MSPLTHDDELVRSLLPAVRATRPADSLRRNRAVDQAISPDGYIKARAILTVTNDCFGGGGSSVTDTNSSTVNQKSYLTKVFTLPDGVWDLYIWGGITGTLSTNSNLNSYLLANGTLSDNFQIPLTSTQIGTIFPEMWLYGVVGGSELEIALQFRPSAGTATVEAGHFKFRGERKS